jgi:nicotinamide phosphoribosyltransferase
MNPLFEIDFYKVGHVSQYPEGTKQIWSNWTPRSSRILDQKYTVFFGLQYFIKNRLQKGWNEGFFKRPKAEVLSEYRELIKATLGIANPKVDHIEYLHDLGYLPIDIYALPEGARVPLGCPALVITNTDQNCFWLPNFLETCMSNVLWKPSTSATTAQRFRKLFVEYATKAGETDLGFVDWMGHDFSYRGMSGYEDAILSGMGHLLSFNGTDTIPAILAAKEFYGANLSCGGSVPATEHSVMCAGGKDEEFETFRRLIMDVYPTGIVSIVSDTWDLWRVITDYVKRLKPEILARDGKLVIRPDSGDPVKIVCGDKDIDIPNTDYPLYLAHHPAHYGALQLLAMVLGTDSNRKGLPLINKAGVIYGDGISVERASAILDRTVNDLKLSPYNLVFGIGSYTYEYVTRDTYNWAMKATAVRTEKGVQAIFKNPITDHDFKKSHKGIPAVYRTRPDDANPGYYVEQGANPAALDACAFRKVFSNGNLLVEQTFDEIRARVRA